MSAEASIFHKASVPQHFGLVHDASWKRYDNSRNVSKNHNSSIKEKVVRLPYLDLTNLPKKQNSILQQANAQIVVNKALPLSGEYSIIDDPALNVFGKSRP